MVDGGGWRWVEVGDAGTASIGGTWHWRRNDVGGEVVWIAGYFGLGGGGLVDGELFMLARLC